MAKQAARRKELVRLREENDRLLGRIAELEVGQRRESSPSLGAGAIPQGHPDTSSDSSVEVPGGSPAPSGSGTKGRTRVHRPNNQ